MYESKHQAVLARPNFVRRLFVHALLIATILGGSLGIGMAGYRGLEGLSFLDAFLNSAMLLGGMGPVNMPVTPAGKVFAGVYALYAGLVFILTAALIITPWFHRLLHKFHIDTK